MLEAIAIAALVMGGVSAANVSGNDVAAEDTKPVTVEVQKSPVKTEKAPNPFLD